MIKRLLESFGTCLNLILIFRVSGLEIISENGVIYYYITDETVPITCKFSDNENYNTVAWYEDSTPIVTAIIRDCLKTSGSSNVNIDCDKDKKEYTAKIPINAIIDGHSWTCRNSESSAGLSTEAKVFRIFPVTTVTIKAAGENNTLNIVKGERRTLTCTTTTCRPAAWIQWYMLGNNVTNDAIPFIQENGTQFITYSELNYTGKEADHNKSVTCESTNIEGIQKVKFTAIIQILVPVSKVTIQPDTDLTVILGKERDFTCITDLVRPAASVQWYIGERNLTNAAATQLNLDRFKFVSSSKLVYIGDEADHNKSLYCEAINIEGRSKVRSKSLNVAILVPITSAFIEPNGKLLNVVIEEKREITCVTNDGRPAAWIQWYIGGRNITNNAVPQSFQSDGFKFKTISKLNYTGQENDHNKSIYCEAVNIDGTKKVRSEEKSIYIQVPVKSVTMTEDGENGVVSVVQGDTLTLTCITDPSRPAALVQWFIGDRNVTVDAEVQSPENDGTKYISSSKLVYLGLEADHNESVYCEAVNIEGMQKVMSMHILLFIKVPAEDVTVESDNGIVVAISGYTINLKCTAHNARPASWINWSIDDQNVTKDASSVIIPNLLKYNTESILKYTGKITDHGKMLICSAGIIQGTTVKTSNITFWINSSPVADGILETDVGVRENEGFNLSISLIANPKPTIEWTFTNSTGFHIALENTLIQTVRNGTFKHITIYSKAIAKLSDFGNYTIFASNGIGEEFTHSMFVVPTQKPRSPYGIFAECFQTSANVSWVSNFNGGDQQIFAVILTDERHNKKTTKGISDKGKDVVHITFTDKLQPDTMYKIHVRSANTYGETISTEVINCTTDALIRTSQNSLLALIGGISGSIVAVLVIVLLIVVVLRLQRALKGNDKEYLKKLEDNNAENTEDDLKDNPLYISSVDTAINTKITRCASAKQGVRSNIKAENVKKNKAGKNGFMKHGFEMDCVYENSADLRKDDDTKASSGELDSSTILTESVMKKNKDGLIYADLEFSPEANKSLFIIRGLEDRTNYATIDISRKGEPLPDSDENDFET